MLKNIRKKVSKEIKSHTTCYILLATILTLAFFVRVYRVDDLLRFYYDQGRDALVIWKLWHEGRPFLIGPVTGLQGIFLGPFYYYLIAPFYLIGGGNPVYPAVFLSFLSTLAILMLYVLGKEMYSRATGIFAATIGAFSYYIVLHSRWLSNPNPILLTSLLLLYSMWKVIQDKNSKWWIAIAFFVGISLQLESASGVFYIPVVGIFWLWQYFSFQQSTKAHSRSVDLKQILKQVQNDKNMLILPTVVFLVTLLPQILFNFRHENLLLNNFSNLFFKEKAFRPMTLVILETRLNYFWNVLIGKLFTGQHKHAETLVVLSASALFVKRKEIGKNFLTLFAIFLITPMIGYIFFQGNHGNIYDYYMSGYYFPMILLFAIGLGALWKTFLGKAVVIAFFVIFLNINIPVIRNFLTATVETRPIGLEEQLKVVDWVYEDVEKRCHSDNPTGLKSDRAFISESDLGDEILRLPSVVQDDKVGAQDDGVVQDDKDTCQFNINIYVPPVIPHTYDYLFLWQGSKKCGENLCGIVEEPTSLLYTLYEADPPHPERLNTWLDKQSATGVVEEESQFGMITVQRRRRF
ncbi:glycosyltransferase family 39 protein [Patescibacteria group bacterium]|nr:glycosyltransferase family 39 protein [Patescibacteria group bacterium]